MTRELLKDKLTEKLIEGISSGRYPVGSLLPKELQLVESEGVSRHTVRAALAKIERLGLIQRTPHVGTRVVSRGRVQTFIRNSPRSPIWDGLQHIIRVISSISEKSL